MTRKGRLAVLETEHRLLAERLNRELIHAEENRQIALAAMDRRLDGMNEFRQQIESAESTYANKTEMGIIHARIDSLKESNDARFRALERMIYMGLGGLTVIVFVLNFLRK